MSDLIKLAVLWVVVVLLMVALIGITNNAEEKRDCPQVTAQASLIIDQPLEYKYNGSCKAAVTINGVKLWLSPYDIINGVEP